MCVYPSGAQRACVYTLGGYSPGFIALLAPSTRHFHLGARRSPLRLPSQARPAASAKSDHRALGQIRTRLGMPKTQRYSFGVAAPSPASSSSGGKCRRRSSRARSGSNKTQHAKYTALLIWGRQHGAITTNVVSTLRRPSRIGPAAGTNGGTKGARRWCFGAKGDLRSPRQVQNRSRMPNIQHSVAAIISHIWSLLRHPRPGRAAAIREARYPPPNKIRSS